MRYEFAILQVSRVLFYVVLFVLYIVSATSLPMVGLCAVSLVFFLATSAVILGWLLALDRWRTPASMPRSPGAPS